MDGIFINFNDQSKSKTRVAAGIVWILLGIVYLFLQQSKAEVEIWETLYAVVFILAGVIHIIIGMGSTIQDKFGKRFVRINEKEIIFKYNFLGDHIELAWDDIKSIKMKSTVLEFTTKDNSKEKTNIARLNYKDVKEIKEYLSVMIEKKDIREE